MQLHQLRPIHKKKRKKRIGRGGKRGTYSGRGMKGQKSRAGAKIKSSFLEAFRKLPKRRGAGGKRKKAEAKRRFRSIRPKPEIINIKELEEKFKGGDLVTPKILLKMGLIGSIKGGVKILGEGKLMKKLVVEGCLLSKSAKEKIEKARGKIKS